MTKLIILTNNSIDFYYSENIPIVQTKIIYWLGDIKIIFLISLVILFFKCPEVVILTHL